MAERVLDLAEVCERGEVAGESMNAWLLATFPFTTPSTSKLPPLGGLIQNGHVDSHQ